MPPYIIFCWRNLKFYYHKVHYVIMKLPNKIKNPLCIYINFRDLIPEGTYNQEITIFQLYLILFDF